MQVKDELAWDELVEELKTTPEGIAFLDFTVGWCDNAEQIMGQDTSIIPSECLRMTLHPTEEKFETRNNVWVVGQMVAVVSMHWAFGGEDFIDSLTEIELRLVQEVTAAKIAQLEDMAEAGNKP